MRQCLKKMHSLMKASNGFITTAQVTDAGIPRRCLTELVVSGDVYKVERGIYARPDVLEDELFVLQYRFGKGIFSYGTALYLHAMTDRTPHIYTMTFPHGYNAGGVRSHNVTVKYAIPDNYDLGVVACFTPYGNKVRTYDIERTLCDIVRGKNAYDIQSVNAAMKAYAVSSKKDVGKLIKYAEQLRVKSKILTYMEILL